MIIFENVGKRYATGREALVDATFHVNPGEMVFLTGHSGAGKSTLLKLIAAIERPTRGEVTVGRQKISALSRAAVAPFRRHIGMVFQDHKLLYDRPVFDNVALPLVVDGVPRREIDKRVRAALDQVGLLGRENGFPMELSTGEQQRVGIARAVVSRPAILIADEPTGNLDPELAIDVMGIFQRFHGVGTTVVIATHDVHLIERFPVRRLHLGQGRVLRDEPAASGDGNGLGVTGGSRG
jgi:cell division transport system ATP-binding protein